MFILPDRAVPRNSAALTAALRAGLTKFFQGTSPALVSVSGDFPTLGSVEINLDEAEWKETATVPDVKPVGTSEPGPTAARFSCHGRPITIHSIQANAGLECIDAAFEYSQNAAGGRLILLKTAKSGALKLSVTAFDLQAAALDAAQHGAEPHGVAVQLATVNLKSLSPHSLAVDLQLTVKKFMTAVISITGHLDLDDHFVARATQLQANGSGMVGSLAAGLISSQLRKIDGQPLALSMLLPAQVHLRSFALTTNDGGLQVAAEFGE